MIASYFLTLFLSDSRPIGRRLRLEPPTAGPTFRPEEEAPSHVHPDRADPEPCNLEVPARPRSAAQRHRELPRCGLGGALAPGRAALHGRRRGGRLLQIGRDTV